MRFEDLIAWQRARELTNAVYALCRIKPLAGDFSLRDQIQRAAVSSMNNLAEGFERSGKAEKLQFYNIAKGSAGEVKSICYVILDNHLAPHEQTVRTQELAAQTSALIAGLERVMNFLENIAVQCNYIRALRLGWQQNSSSKAVVGSVIPATLPMRSGHSVRPISRS